MVTYWLKSKKLRQYIKSTGILLIPVALYIVPLNWLYNQHSICLFKNLTGLDCYGCGMTRAILSALHFHFESAFYYNKLFVIVLPLLIYIWTMSIIKYWPKKTSP
jgi:hypothetical protein